MRLAGAHACLGSSVSVLRSKGPGVPCTRSLCHTMVIYNNDCRLSRYGHSAHSTSLRQARMTSRRRVYPGMVPARRAAQEPRFSIGFAHGGRCGISGVRNHIEGEREETKGLLVGLCVRLRLPETSRRALVSVPF